ITQAQFEELMNAAVHDYSEFANWDSRQRIGVMWGLWLSRCWWAVVSFS
ncbi:hypothetical protein, partial [Pseudomonas aeruginosa]